MKEKLKLFNPLTQFVGHKVYFEKTDEVSFIYQSFQLDLDSYENVAILYDENNDTCKTYIPTFGLDGINVTGNDLYDSIVEIDSTHYNYFISCAEEIPIFPTCARCKKILDEYDHPWCVNQQAGYFSDRDGQRVSVKVCNECFEEMFGGLIPATEEYGWYS